MSDFDARALSTFNIVSDKTVNKMCSEVQTTCSNLMGIVDVANLWASGMTSIATDITYQKVIETCTSIGRDCIIRQCNGTSGNFALCQKATDKNRQAILDHDVCWDEVLKCVESADNLDNMTVMTHDEYLNSAYEDVDLSSIEPPVSCDDADKACLITEQIWGTCEYKSNRYSITEIEGTNYKPSNKILTPSSGDSLLSWFASNTGTSNDADSCNSNGCPINYEKIGLKCQLAANLGTTTDGQSPQTPKQVVNVTNTITNYCYLGERDVYGNCCDDTGLYSGESALNNGICVPRSGRAVRLWNLKCTSIDDYLCPTTGNLALYCVTSSTNEKPILYSEYSNDYFCGFIGENEDGMLVDEKAVWVIIDENGNYYNANKDTPNTGPKMYYRNQQRKTCTRTYRSTNGTWRWTTTNGVCTDGVPTYPTNNNELLIKYNLN